MSHQILPPGAYFPAEENPTGSFLCFICFENGRGGAGQVESEAFISTRREGLTSSQFLSLSLSLSCLVGGVGLSLHFFMLYLLTFVLCCLLLVYLSVFDHVSCSISYIL